MLSAFTAVLHVPNISQPDHLMSLLEEHGGFKKEQLQMIARKIDRRRVFIGVKKLLAFIDMAKQVSLHATFLL